MLGVEEWCPHSGVGGTSPLPGLQDGDSTLSAAGSEVYYAGPEHPSDILDLEPPAHTHKKGRITSERISGFPKNPTSGGSAPVRKWGVIVAGSTAVK